MKKCFYFLVLILSVLNMLFTNSCNDMPTYEEMKSAEQKLIRRMISEKNITLLTEYPTDGVFKENEFFQLSSGIYLNVVDSGNGNRAVRYNTDVLVRVSGEYHDDKDSLVQFNTFMNELYPFEFKYGLASLSIQANQYNSYYNKFFSLGIESILTYVGDSAVVKLIVPGYSEINGVGGGSTYQSAISGKYIPIYYDRIKYIYY